MKLISWNVNGIRAIQSKGFGDAMTEIKPDILCLQETKAEQSQVSLPLKGYHTFWNSAQKKGYSGTAIFTREKPLNVFYGIGREEHDQEGRVVTLEFSDFFVVTVYVPNSKRELLRLEYRMQWDSDFMAYLLALDAKKPVIFCGDLNVAHQDIDIARPKDNRRNPGFTDEERNGFTALLNAGFVDTFRSLHPETIKYSWWLYMFQARARNVGWRIDYVCTSRSLAPRVQDSFILNEYFGSDHCPVGAIIS
ncbi:MAG: exodeoxyribonuclease III [Patescibacteria group bacterium]